MREYENTVNITKEEQLHCSPWSEILFGAYKTPIEIGGGQMSFEVNRNKQSKKSLDGI